MKTSFMMLAAAQLVALANAESVSPVQKVIQLLGELKTKVTNDLAAESKAMDEYTTYCDDEITAKVHSLDIASREIESYEAVIESSAAKVSEFEAVLADSGSSIAGKEGEKADAESIRASEAKDFKAGESELVDAIDMLSRAASVLKRELSFAQGGVKDDKKLKDTVRALSAIINASWVNVKDAKKINSFVEEGPSKDDDLSLVQASQPQASSYTYESKSGGIVATIEDMQDKAEGQLQELRKSEMQKKFDFQLLTQSLSDSIVNLEKTVKEATASKSNAEETKAKAQGDLAKTKESKAADEAYKAKMTTECQNKAAEWDGRQKSAAGEVEALEKAKEILSSGVKAFVQTALLTRKAKSVAKSDEQRQELVRELKKLGRKFNSFGLIQMANRAKSDPFVKIRSLVEDMIAKLETQAAEEATHDAWCKEENTKSVASRDAKIEKVDKYQSRIDKASATVDTLKQEVAELSSQLTELASSVKTATAIRVEEKGAYEKASKDYKDSADAVTQAMEVLKEYYGGAALIQMKQPTFAAANSDSGSNIISFLEVAQSDFTRLYAESEADEAEAVKAYESLMQESAVSKATKEAETKGKKSEIKSLEVAIADSSADLENSQKELDAVMDYLQKLKPQCESKAMTYEERKEKRDTEIAGLKQALSILAGDEPALSFLQKRSH